MRYPAGLGPVLRRFIRIADPFIAEVIKLNSRNRGLRLKPADSISKNASPVFGCCFDRVPVSHFVSSSCVLTELPRIKWSRRLPGPSVNDV